MMRDILPIVLELVLFVFLAVVIVAISFSTAIKIEAEYMTGMLSASSILFGFWFILIEKKPKDETKRFLYENAIFGLFFVSFGILLLSVVLLYLSAIEIIPSIAGFVSITLGFLLNAFSVGVSVYYFKFKERKI